jgi:hypothetical protein
MADHRSVVTGDRWSWVFAGTLLVAAVTGVVALLVPHLPGPQGLPTLYLLAILPSPTGGGRRQVWWWPRRAR